MYVLLNAYLCMCVSERNRIGRVCVCVDVGEDVFVYSSVSEM
jgi:hypothetical protein